MGSGWIGGVAKCSGAEKQIAGGGARAFHSFAKILTSLLDGEKK